MFYAIKVGNGKWNRVSRGGLVFSMTAALGGNRKEAEQLAKGLQPFSTVTIGIHRYAQADSFEQLAEDDALQAQLDADRKREATP